MESSTFRRQCVAIGYRVLFGALIAISLHSEPILTVQIEHAYVPSTDTSGTLTIYLENRVDSVAGFQFWLKLNRPDIALFTETFDTVGTLASGFELVHVKSSSGTGTELQVIGLADDYLTPGYVPPITPHTGLVPLIRIPFRLLPISDTTTDRTAAVMLDPNPSWLSFSRPNGTMIGLSWQLVADTACWRCDSWIGDVCLGWHRVSLPPCDSTSIALDSIQYLDSVKFTVVPGSITNVPCPRTVQDLDINGDGIPMSVADYVALLRYILGDTTSIANPLAADLNGDCKISWADAYLLDSLFTYGHWNPPPEFGPYFPCSCQRPVRVCCWQTRGNVDNDYHHVIDLTDLSVLVSYLTAGTPVLKCQDEANVNGQGSVDLSDMSYLIAFLTGNGGPPPPCQ